MSDHPSGSAIGTASASSVQGSCFEPRGGSTRNPYKADIVASHCMGAPPPCWCGFSVGSLSRWSVCFRWPPPDRRSACSSQLALALAAVGHQPSLSIDADERWRWRVHPPVDQLVGCCWSWVSPPCRLKRTRTGSQHQPDAASTSTGHPHDRPRLQCESGCPLKSFLGEMATRKGHAEDGEEEITENLKG